MKPFVEITNLKKEIEDFKLGPLDLTIEAGTITALVGNNGSGKSTLLKLIMHLAKRDAGEIKLFNQPVYGTDESWKTLVAYQSQTTIGYDPFTGEQLRSLVSHWYPAWDEALFAKMVKLLDIPLNKQFGKLSQGSQQKLILALTIPRNTNLLILDEPMSFIDIPSKKILMNLLVEWIEQDERAIIIASHQIDDIMKLADYLFVLRSGETLGMYEKEALTESYQRYWINETFPPMVPGEVLREDNSIVSNQPSRTENFLNEKDVKWSNQAAVELEEVITILLTKTD